jgi:hypothetical protein
MRLGLFLSFFFFCFGVVAQPAVPADTSHYFSVYGSSYLKGENGEIFPDHIELSPDGLSYIAYVSKVDNKRIWTSTDGINWAGQHVSFDNSFYIHLSKDAPGSFSISDLKFNPRISSVMRSSWNREPLLSFYLWSDMHFINSSTAYMNTDGKIYKTTDGGNHWNRLLDTDKYVSKIFYCKNDVYAVLQTHEFIKIGPAGTIRKIGRFKSGKHADEISSIQFQNDSTLYFLVGNGTGEMKYALYKSVNDAIIRKPFLRNLSASTQMIVTEKSIILRVGEKLFFKSDDGGYSWIHYKKQDASHTAMLFVNIRGIYLDHDSVPMGFGFSSQPNSSIFSMGKILFDKHPDSIEAAAYKIRIQAFNEKEKGKQDSDNYCNCRDYAASIQNHRQIENGTYYQTQLTYLVDKAPDITLKDGKFWYNPKLFNKESTIENETMPETRGAYVASENIIVFSSDDSKNYFNGTYYYMFDGNNFSIYKCDMKAGQTNLIQFHNFGTEDIYNPPVAIEKSTVPGVSHASDFVYSFTSDSNKFILNLVDIAGKPVSGASIKFDDIYATPIFDGQYYFDKRTLNEFTPLNGKPAWIIISHPEYDPLLVSFPATATKYVLQRKEKK